MQGMRFHGVTGAASRCARNHASDVFGSDLRFTERLLDGRCRTCAARAESLDIMGVVSGAESADLEHGGRAAGLGAFGCLEHPERRSLPQNGSVAIGAEGSRAAALGKHADFAEAEERFFAKLLDAARQPCGSA